MDEKVPNHFVDFLAVVIEMSLDRKVKSALLSRFEKSLRRMYLP